MKKCTKCGIEKEKNEFPVSEAREYSWCRECVRKNSRKHHAANKDKENYKEKRRQYYLENKYEQLNKQKEYYWKNREAIRNKAKERRKTAEEREKQNKRSREWLVKNRDKHAETAKRFKQKHPEKVKAHQYVLWALRLGVLVKPEVCEKCKRTIKLESHHLDYSKPLEVQWVCRTCHMHIHGKLLHVKPGEENVIGNTS